MFKKPNWLKPEINESKYWIHLVIIVVMVYFLINKFLSPMDITLENVGLGVIFVGIADITAHTILRLD